MPADYGCFVILAFPLIHNIFALHHSLPSPSVNTHRPLRAPPLERGIWARYGLIFKDQFADTGAGFTRVAEGKGMTRRHHLLLNIRIAGLLPENNASETEGRRGWQTARTADDRQPDDG
ncbi:hypothetical protein BJ912DRAFT_1067885 [Pholiota molesta]|nr:hypothetical protein BJ912DRAFT_1067885 [Pholiota molesta]